MRSWRSSSEPVFRMAGMLVIPPLLQSTPPVQMLPRGPAYGANVLSKARKRKDDGARNLAPKGRRERNRIAGTVPDPNHSHRPPPQVPKFVEITLQGQGILFGTE